MYTNLCWYCAHKLRMHIGSIVITWWKWFFFPNYVFCGEGTIIYVMTGSKFMCIQCLLFYPRMQYFMLIKIFYLHLKLDLRKLWLVHILFKSMESYVPIWRNISNCMIISTIISFLLIPYSWNIPRSTYAHISQ